MRMRGVVRSSSGAARRRRLAAAELIGDPDGRRLGEAERHHETHASDVEDQLMRRQRIGADRPHHDAGHHEHPDLEPSHGGDRQAKPQDAGYLAPGAATHADRYPCPGDQHVEGEAEERQPLHDGRGAPRTRAAQGRHPPMSEDQGPVQNQVQRHRKQRDDHDDPGAKRRNQQEAQHRRTEEPRNAPGNLRQKTAYLRHQAGS